MAKKKKLFCEISPTTYAISLQKGICQRHVQDMFSKEKFASEVRGDKLPNVVSTHSSNIIKRAPGVDPVSQENKATNIEIGGNKINGTIIHPGEVFSFWRAVGKTTAKNGFKEGRVLVSNKLQPGVGGGLCNLGNTIHMLILHSPLEVTEIHYHSDALAPDPNGIRVPFSAGTSVSYNYIDFRFRNNTDQDVQLIVWRDGEISCAELRSEKEFPWTYRIVEEDHHFEKQGEKYYRIGKIYKETLDRETGELIKRELIRDNHSEVMFDYDLIPKEQIR